MRGLKDPVQLVLVLGYLSLALIAILLSNFGQYVPAIFAVVSLALLLTFTARRIFGRQALVVGLFTFAIVAVLALATHGIWLRALDRLAEQMLGQPLLGELSKAPSEVAIMAITGVVGFAAFALRRPQKINTGSDQAPKQRWQPRPAIIFSALGLFFALGATLIIWFGLTDGESIDTTSRPIIAKTTYFSPEQSEPETIDLNHEFGSPDFQVTGLQNFSAASPSFDAIPMGAFMLSGTKLRVAPQVLRTSKITSCLLSLQFDIENERNETRYAQLTLAWHRVPPEITYQEVSRETRDSGWGERGGPGKYCGSQMIRLQASHPGMRIRVLDTSERGKWTGFLNREREYRYGCVLVIEQPVHPPTLGPDCSRQ